MEGSKSVVGEGNFEGVTYNNAYFIKYNRLCPGNPDRLESFITAGKRFGLLPADLDLYAKPRLMWLSFSHNHDLTRCMTSDGKSLAGL